MPLANTSLGFSKKGAEIRSNAKNPIILINHIPFPPLIGVHKFVI
jgi:hypothetical protein